MDIHITMILKKYHINLLNKITCIKILLSLLKDLIYYLISLLLYLDIDILLNII